MSTPTSNIKPSNTASAKWIRTLPAGETLFKEGDVDRRVFVLLDGRVEIYKGLDRIAEIGVADSFIGEVSALTGKPRWAAARTLAPTTLIVVEDVGDLFTAGSSWAFKLAQVLANRLDRTNERLKRVQLLLEETRTRGADETLVATLKVVVEGAEKGAD